MEPLTTLTVASATTALGETAGGLATTTATTLGAFSPSACSGAMAALGKLGAKIPLDSLLEQLVRSVGLQVTNELGKENNTLSFIANSALLSSLDVLNADPVTLEGVPAGDVDTTQIDDTIGKLEQRLNITPVIARAMGRAALMECGKQTGVPVNQLAAIALNTCSSIKEFSPALQEAAQEVVEKSGPLAYLLDFDKLKVWISEKLTSFISPEQTSDQLWLKQFKGEVGMQFLQECADEVGDYFNLSKLPVDYMEGNFAWTDSGTAAWTLDDRYAGDPELISRMLNEFGESHLPIQEQARTLSTLLFAHEATHYLFAHLPVRYPRIIEEYACDLMIGAFANAKGLDLDLVQRFYQVQNNHGETYNRVFSSENTPLYPSALERAYSVEAMKQYMAEHPSIQLRDLVQNPEALAQIAANALNIKMEFDAESSSYQITENVISDIRDVLSEDTVASMEQNLEAATLKGAYNGVVNNADTKGAYNGVVNNADTKGAYNGVVKGAYNGVVNDAETKGAYNGVVNNVDTKGAYNGIVNNADTKGAYNG